MKKGKLISCLILIGIILALPSVFYLVKNIGNIAEYSGEYYYWIGENGEAFTKFGAIIFGWCILLMFLIYIKLIQKSDKFENIKDILIAAGIVGIAFIIALPNTSKDVFFYMGNGRAIDKYNVNPYTTSVSEIEDLDTTDVLLKTVGNQKEYKFVYGPVFLTICGLLNRISFSSVALFLYEFKILNFIMYLATTFLIYKLTSRKKLAVCFAFNPLVLLEVLVNVHNDIFVVFFALLGIWFIKEGQKIEETSALETIKSEMMFIDGLLFLAIAACIKYIVIAIVPFLILYKIRNEKTARKVLHGVMFLIVFVAIFFAMYTPYFKTPMEAFSGVVEQTGKFKDSIYLLIVKITEEDSNIVSIFYSIGFFVLAYIFIVEILKQIFRKNNFKVAMENSFIILFGLIFLALTNLTSWYLLWLFVPVFWTTGKRVKDFIWIGLLYELTYVMFYITHSDSTVYQVWILPWIAFGMIAREIFLSVRAHNSNTSF